jgi:ribosomal subunit interface protein
MDVKITARHLSLSETTQQDFKERIAHIGRFDHKVQYIDVVCDKSHDKAQMEWKIGISHQQPIVVHTEADTLSAALDILMDKAEKALTKSKEKRLDKDHTRLAEAAL